MICGRRLQRGLSSADWGGEGKRGRTERGARKVQAAAERSGTKIDDFATKSGHLSFTHVADQAKNRIKSHENAATRPTIAPELHLLHHTWRAWTTTPRRDKRLRAASVGAERLISAPNCTPCPPARAAPANCPGACGSRCVVLGDCDGMHRRSTTAVRRAPVGPVPGVLARTPVTEP